MINIRRSFSKKLSVALFLLAVPIFVVSLGVLFTQSRQMIRNEAIGHAGSVLGATMQQLRRNLITIETATNANLWQVEQSFTPDSILHFTNHVVSINPPWRWAFSMRKAPAAIWNPFPPTPAAG